MFKNAQVSISRNNHNMVTIRIEDEDSRNQVVAVEMDLESYGKLLTGLAHVPAQVTHSIHPDDAWKLGKKKITERVEVDTNGVYRKDEIKEMVRQDHALRGLYEDDWFIYSDGTTTQQRGNLHQYIIAKYVDPEPEE